MTTDILDWVDCVYRCIVEVFDVEDNRTYLSYFHTLQPLLTTCPECLAKSRKMLPLLQQSLRHLKAMDHGHASIHTVMMMLIHSFKTIMSDKKAKSSKSNTYKTCNESKRRTKIRTRLVVVGSKNHCLIHIPVIRCSSHIDSDEEDDF